MMKDKMWLWILFFAAIFLYTFNLCELPLRDWDEGIVATVAREIYGANFDDYAWLYPKNIDGNPYWNKPPLIHNLVALSYQVWGVSEWTTRLIPSIISALSVPLLYLIGKEIFSSKKESFIAACIYLTLIPVARHNRLAMLDGTITFEFCFAVWFLLKLKLKQNKNLYLLGIGLSFSLLCLTKGMAIALLVFLIIFIFILSEFKTFSYFFSFSSIIFILIGISPGITWYGLQYFQYGQEFITYNLGTQTFNRVINAVENNKAPVWYYLLELLKYSLPWLVFLPGGIKLAIQQWHNKTWAKLALIWFGGYLVAISLITTKLPWYIIPLYPAFALLTGAKLTKILQQQKKLHHSIYSIFLLILSLIFWLATIYFAFFNQPKDKSLILIALILAITFTVTTLLIRKSPYFIFFLTIGLYIALLTLFNSPHAIWELAEAYPVKPVAELIKANTPKEAVIYTTYPDHRPSLNFYSDRLIIPLSEAKLPEILRQKQIVYLLIPANTSSIANSKVIGATNEWQIVVTK